jgi:hypothetical protein
MWRATFRVNNGVRTFTRSACGCRDEGFFLKLDSLRRSRQALNG